MNGAKQLWLTLLVVLTIITGCRKKEFEHLPEGEQVPYEALKITLSEVLERPEYQLFNKAWKKSNMAAVRNSWGNAAFTLLVPDNAAMRAAGLDDAGIGSSTVEALDSLLMYHTIPARVELAALQSKRGNVPMRTLLLNPVYTEPLNGVGSGVLRDSVYRYRQYLGVDSKGVLFAGGKQVGAGAPVVTKDGNIWLINKVLRPATKNLLQRLQEDGRFHLYLEALRLTDSIYTSMPEVDYYSQGPYLFFQTVFNTTVWDIDWDTFEPIFIYGKVQRFGIFAPTDAAFQQVGLNTVDDLRAMNDRTPPRFEGWSLKHYAVLDSMLRMHAWGKARGMMPSDVLGIFYTNDMIPELMNTFPMSSGVNGGLVVQPLDFSKDGSGRVQIRWKGSTAEKATIIEGDMEAIQGPIHVVDRIIAPPGFSFKH